jgi:hypothetical protein
MYCLINPIPTTEPIEPMKKVLLGLPPSALEQLTKG